MRRVEEEQGHGTGAQVPVEIAPGLPVILEEVEFPDELEAVLLLARFRGDLERARDGAAGLRALRRQLAARPDVGSWELIPDEPLRHTSEWAAWLLQVLDAHDPLKRVLAVSEDCLGIYRFDVTGSLFPDEFTVNRASIFLYWGVIGLVSDWLGCTVDDLTIVVLTHELAHAYTQLGADIEGKRWPAAEFAGAERELTEGLAQYYTERVLVRAERRWPGALRAYRGLLPHQPAAYRTHERWNTSFSPEAVRRAMLEVRRTQEGRLDQFERRLHAAHEVMGVG